MRELVHHEDSQVCCVGCYYPFAGHDEANPETENWEEIHMFKMCPIKRWSGRLRISLKLCAPKMTLHYPRLSVCLPICFAQLEQKKVKLFLKLWTRKE